MRSVITLAVGVALAAALLFAFGATATFAAAPPAFEQDAPTAIAAPTAASAVDVSVSANTGFTRTFQWTLAKSADANPLPLFAGESGAISYTVAGTRNIDQSGFYITGTVLITNPSTISPTTLNTITVKLTQPNINNVPLECGVTLPYALDPDAVLACSFRSPLPGASSRPTATATIFSDDNPTPDTAVTRPLTSTRVIKEIGFAAVTITDTLGGLLGRLPVQGSNPLDFTLDYAYPVECPSDPGEYVDGLRQIPVENTASISETGYVATANVTVDCYAPVVSQQAAGGFTRTWEWGVVKSADTVSATVAQSGTLPIGYTVGVTNAQTDSGFNVAGVISVTNQHPAQAMAVSVAASIPGLGPLTLACGGTLNVPAGQTAGCAYSLAGVPDATPRQSDATVGFAGGDYVSSVPVAFTLADEVDACADVLDDEGTPGGTDKLVGTLCRDAAPHTFTYSAAPTFTACGAQQFVNTVRLAGTDSAALGSDSWTVDVTVDCTPVVVTNKLLLPIIMDAQ